MNEYFKINPRAVEFVLKKCLGHHTGESVVVVTDTAMSEIAEAFHQATVDLGINATLVSMSPRRIDGEEPPEIVAQAMASGAIAILLASRSLIHTKARIEASRRGVRTAGMPGLDSQRLEQITETDYDDLDRRCRDLASLLEGHRKIRILSDLGTDLSFEITGRHIYCDNGLMGAPAAFGSLPAGAVTVAPLEGTASGIAVIDGSIAGLGYPRDPIPLRFVKGHAMDTDDGPLGRLLSPHGASARTLAKFGMGLNPHITIEDEKAFGVVHIALGTNLSMGGIHEAPVHLTMILRSARVEVDGLPIPPFYTHLLSPEISCRDRAAENPLSPDAFRTLFERSNDPYYILDMESRRFLEVNAAFVTLTGYPREELLSGAITPLQLVARESTITYHQKEKSRGMIPSERYDLKILTKGGEKIPVEFSVRRIEVEGQALLFGSIRDLTARKRLEQEMWEKIEELSRANNRIYALTEKIRKVPALTPKLLHLTNEEELLERTGDLLCTREGLGYADVTFYLLRNDALELAYSTIQAIRKRIPLSGDHAATRILFGEDPPLVDDRHAVLPLKGRDKNIGVIEVLFQPKEIDVLKGNERALKGHRDLLETLSNIIGLLIDNLRLYDAVKTQLVIDQLTGVYNRRYFAQKLTDEIQRAVRYARSLCVLMIDIDRFKAVNDDMGHKQGDRVLCEVAALLKARTREVDTVFRYGGDEFVILMPETAYENALAKAESLCEATRIFPIPVPSNPERSIRVTLSIGVTTYSSEIRDGEELVRIADEAMFHAKRLGRNSVHGIVRQPQTQ